MTEPRLSATRRRLSQLIELPNIVNLAGDEETNLAERHRFVRKVYAMLIIKLTVIVPITIFALYNQDVQQFFQKNVNIMLLLLLFVLILTCTLVVYCASKEYHDPVLEFALETLILIVFTIVSVSLFSNAECDREEVLLVIMTSMHFGLGLTIYAIRTKYDYKYTMCATLNGWQNHSKSFKTILAVHGVILLFFIGLLIIYTKFSPQIIGIWLSFIFTPCFSNYFIIQTQLVFGGKHKAVYLPKKSVMAGFFVLLTFGMITYFIILFVESIEGFKE